MMNNLTMITLISMVLVLVIVTSCTTQCPECSCPDCPENQCPVSECVQDCSLCPKNIETKTVEVEVPVEKIVYKYVCADSTIVDKASECSADNGEEASGTDLISSFELDPACIYGYNGGEIHFKLESITNQTIIQVREKGKDFEDVAEIDTSYFESTRSFIINSKNIINSDFHLEKGNVYEIRARFYFPAFNTVQYSDIYEVDTNEGSEYLAKICSS